MRKLPYIWLHKFNKKRDDFGEFHHSLGDLKRIQKSYFKYYIMLQEQFKELLAVVGITLVERKNTTSHPKNKNTIIN